MNGQTSNLFLSSLSPVNCEFLLSLSTAVELPLQTVLYEEECTPRYAYFLTSGLASMVTPMSNGEAVEVGFIGREGVVGSLHLLGPTSLSTRCMMQLSGAALRIQYRELQKAYGSSDEIRDRTLEFVQEQAAMVGQIAGCNRLHSAEQRLIRWLLTAQDRTQTNDLKFTHEYLAEMIATHRTTITTITRALQKRGFITYSRGTIIILNRDGLEGSACDCYGITKRLYANLYAGEALIAVEIPSVTHTMSRTDDKFRHRLDRNGMYHSFCMTCFQTVAKSGSEADLTEGEEQHECFGPPPRWTDRNA